MATVALTVAVVGGAASAHGNAKPASSTSTTTHRKSGSGGSKHGRPILEAGVLYRAPDTPYGGFGDGMVRPKGISTSGVGATNGVEKITWKSWGGRTATGTGTGCILGKTGIEANCHVKRATVVAYDLGTCGGKPAYLAVTWYFPSLGQKPSEKGTIPNPSCSAKTPTSTSAPTAPPSPPPTTTTSVPPTPPVATSAACTATALAAAATAAGIVGVVGVAQGQYQCTGGYAAAGVTLGGPTGGTGSQITAVFKTDDGSWQLVPRDTACTQNLIPAGLHPLACTSN